MPLSGKNPLTMKLTNDKRNKILVVAMVTVAAIGGLWFEMIGSLQGRLAETTKKTDATRQQILDMERVVHDAESVKTNLLAVTQKMDEVENGMASGDLYAWIISAIKRFNVPAYKVEIPQFGSPVEGQVTMLPNFPYRQATIAVGGVAYYYDFGKFLADLENHFPYLRVQNLVLEPSGSANPEDKEKLSFRMEIVMLVKPNAS
jgi:hypothetical protein